MTNKSMISDKKAREQGGEKGGENLGGKPREGTDHQRRPPNEASTDSPQLKPELDEPRTGLRKPNDGAPSKS